MTRSPFPRVAISRDGAHVLAGFGRRVWRVESASASCAVWDLDHSVEVLGVAEDGSAAAAGAGRVTLVAPDALLHCRELHGPTVSRLLLDQYLVVALRDESASWLETWDRADDATLHAGPRWEGVETDGLVGTSDAVVVWGRSGDSLDRSPGVPFVRLCAITPEISERWKGKHGPLRPNGYLLPLGDGVGGYDSETLLEIDVNRDDWPVRRSRGCDGTAQIAASDDGRWVAALSNAWDGSNESQEIMLQNWPESAVAQRTVAHLGSGTAALAVDPAGTVTVAVLSASLGLQVLRQHRTSLRELAEFQLNSTNELSRACTQD